MRNCRYFYSTLAGASLAATAVLSRADDLSRLKENVQAHFLTNDSAEARRCEAIRQASTAINRFMVVSGIPGVSVGVSVDGENVWSEGFGFGDVEMGTRCQTNSVMRIASISKAITSIIAAKLLEAEKLDLDKSIYEYLPDFPRKTFDNEQVDITTRQLFCHMGGIRHYPENNKENKNQERKDGKGETLVDERYLNKQYNSVTESLNLFKNDPLVAKPNTKFHYTTHGYTLIAAVLEKCADKNFQTLLCDLFDDIGMHTTSIDKKREIVANRCKHYARNKDNRLENVPEVDTSYKWAGGGLISNVEDLLKLANTVLYSYQSTPISQPPPYLKRETAEKLWNIEAKTKGKYYYGLGWMIDKPKALVGGIPENGISGFCFHTGAGIGASSILFIKPSTQVSITTIEKAKSNPRGVCVVILSNCGNSGAGITSLACYIAEQFESEECAYKNK